MKCSKIRIKTNDFVEKSKKIHGNKYDYSLVDYINAKSKVKIICPEHGVFEQKPEYHIKCKIACKECQKKEIRLRTLKRIKKNKLNNKQLYPNFNEKACLIFNEINKKNEINIRHATNGGEFFIRELGYWVDGYDEENNVVYEYDESHHFKNGKLRKKDIDRQKNIINYLNCEFIRIKEKDIKKNKIKYNANI